MKNEKQVNQILPTRYGEQYLHRDRNEGSILSYSSSMRKGEIKMKNIIRDKVKKLGTNNRMNIAKQIQILQLVLTNYISFVSFNRQRKSRTIIILLMGILSLSFGLATLNAQSAIATKGVYTGPVTDGADIFSGKLEEVIPLLKIQGRGEGSHTLALPLRNFNEWQVVQTGSGSTGGNTPQDFVIQYYQAKQADNFNTAGIDYSSRGGYGNSGRIEVKTMIQGNFNFATVTTVKFISNTGAIIDFRDNATNGQPFDATQLGCVTVQTYPVPPSPAGCSRGRVFKSVDSSNATFVADTDIYDNIIQNFANGERESNQPNINGTLYLSNGTRIRIGDGFNNVTNITDRNGNSINFNYDWVQNPDPNYPNGRFYRLTKITDSLNREVQINYGDQTQSEYFDELIYKGTGGAERRIRINYKDVSQVLAPGQQILTKQQLFPEVTARCYTLQGSPTTCSGVPTGGSDPAPTGKVVASIVLPNNKEYDFFYNSYYEVARISYPTGGYADYQYSGLTGASSDGFIQPIYSGGGSIYRRVSDIKVYDVTGQLVSEKTISNVPQQYGATSTNSPAIDNVTIASQSSDGTVLEKSKHYFHGTFDELSHTWVSGKEYMSENLDPSTQAVLRRTETTWEQREPFPWCTGAVNNMYGCDNTNFPYSAPPNDPRIKEIKTTLETGQVADKTFSYDNFNNLADTYEYDFGSGSPGALMRRSHTDYVTDPNYTEYTGAHIRGLASQNWVSSDAAGNNKVSFSQTEYDNYANDTNHASLVDRSNVTGHDSNLSSGNPWRGNVTGATSYADAANQSGAVTAYSQYDILGNVVKIIDASGNVGTVGFNDNFGLPDGEAETNSAPSKLNGNSTFALATSTTNPKGWTTHVQYDYYTGAAVDGEDINGVVSSTFYSDQLDRPTQSIAANNISNLRLQTTITYDDTNHKVTKTSDLYAYGDNLSKSEGYFDGLGRIKETRGYEKDGGYITTLTEYDALGRVKRVTNPYRPLQNESQLWTTSIYDSLGRITNVTTPDNAQTQTSYSGNTVTATDQAGKQHRSITNSLGELTRVDEPDDSGNLGTVSSPNQATNYIYDTIGNMVKVTQGVQNRYFKYDGLGRLLRVRQPEEGTNSSLSLADAVTGNSDWSAGFTYDANGNMLTATDTKGTVITNTYDNLNRVLTRTYSDSTPTVTNTYDDSSIQYSKGHLTKTVNSVSTSQILSLDNLGRVLSSRQITDGNNYDSSFTYNLAGAVIEETYPSGRKVKNTFETDGDLSKVETKTSAGNYETRADNFSYTSNGAIGSMKLGNSRWETTQYNNRLQPTLIGLGTSQNATDLLKLEYGYGTTDNNGNVKSQTITVPSINQLNQTYSYDSLNRLKSATETSNGSQTWKQTFIYDRYGNRNFDTVNTTTLGSCAAAVCNPTIDGTTNRFTTGQGYTYDLSGNIIADPDGRQFTFNGDNKQTQVKDANNNVIGTYYYDGDGKRIKKVTNTETTTFVYSGGKLAAEYQLTNSTSTTPTTQYLTTDVLGSPRAITDQAGNIVSRRDFMPFGEELSNIGGRSAGNGFTTDNVRQKFTGYQKDDETGLDFAEARYYNSKNGRFTAIDPLLASGQSANPQTFNRYSYVGNNPAGRVDPTGTDWYEHTEAKVNRDGTSTNVTMIFWRNENLGMGGYTSYTGSGVFRETWGKHSGKWVALDPYEGRIKRFNSREAAVAQYQKYLTDRNINATRGFTDAIASLGAANPITKLLYEWGEDAVIGPPDPKSNVYTIFNRSTHAMITVAMTAAGPVIEGALAEEATVEVTANVESVEAETIETTTETQPEIPDIIYRQGKTNPGNLTPRPKDEGLLSFRDSISNPYPLPEGHDPVMNPGEPFFGINTENIPPESFVFDDIPGHVMVRDVPAHVLKDAVVVKGKFPE